MKDWKRNNSVKIRNTHPSVALHDVVKLLLVRLIRRQNPSVNFVDIYTEHNVNQPNKSYPDIQVTVHGSRNQTKDYKNIVYEIQEQWTDEWEKKILKKYEDSDVIFIRLKKLVDNFKNNFNIDLKDVIEKLNINLEKQFTVGKLY